MSWPNAPVTAGRRTVRRVVALGVAALVLTSCGTWRGIAGVPLPGGPGTGSGSYTVYVQVPDTLALNVNSRVRVADVFVGTVRAIQLRNWVATLTLDIDKGVRLPANATAKIGQTSLLGSQHVELAAPPDPSPEPLRPNGTIPLKNSSSFPTTERTLASVATVLNGGGIPNLEVISTEVNNILTGNADQIRDFLGNLDTFTNQLNQQRDDITHAIDATNRLVTIAANNANTLDRVLTEFPPLIKHFADTRERFANAITSVGGLSAVVDRATSASRSNLDQNLRLLQRPLKQLGKAAPLLVEALKLLLTAPFTVDNIPKAIRGDYINVSLTLDLTLSALDNGLLTGTGFSGALRALEQSWGRDPATMIPDVRFSPNPADVAPERGE